MMTKRAGFLALTALFCFLAVLGGAQSIQAAAQAASEAAITRIQLLFKRDPRAVDPYRGQGPWASGRSFGGATGQETIEVRAEGVDAAGKTAKITPQWIPSDPEMVTVSPSQGDDVKITVHRAGKSKLQITYKHLSKEWEIKAQYVGKGKFMLVEIAETAAPKPSEPVTTAAPPASPSKNDLSYAAGMNLAKALQHQSVEVDVDHLMQGIKDTLSGDKTRMTQEAALGALQGVETDQRIVETGVNRKARAEKNRREGEAFLAENKKQEGVVTLTSGLQYKIIKAGDGRIPTASDVVTVKYRGTFIDGKEFDNTFKRGSMSLPVTASIQGWREALQLMPVGSRWQLFVPADLAYGERGARRAAGRKAKGARVEEIVGPNVTLIFDMEVLAVRDASDTAPAVAIEDKSDAAQSAVTLIKDMIRAHSPVVDGDAMVSREENQE